MKIYHNPKCRKSREVVNLFREKNIKFDTVEYIKNGVTNTELKSILKKLNIKAIELIRKNEKIWKDNYKDKVLNEKEILDVMIKNPKLIERPIIISNEISLIGRPIENVKKTFQL